MTPWSRMRVANMLAEVLAQCAQKSGPLADGGFWQIACHPDLETRLREALPTAPPAIVQCDATLDVGEILVTQAPPNEPI